MDQTNPSPEELDDFLSDAEWEELRVFFLDQLRVQLQQMEEHSRDGDCSTLARIGHSLKGAGAGIRFPRFSEMGRALEEASRRGDLIRARNACRAIREEFLLYRPDERQALLPYFDDEATAEERKSA